METGHVFTVQGRFPVGLAEIELEEVLYACDACGVMDAAVSLGDGYLGVTGTITAIHKGDALRLMQECILIPADKLEVLP